MGYTPNTWRPMDVITSKKLNDLEQGLTQTSDNVVYGMGGATQSSDGIHSLTYINKGDALPNNPQVGDTIFMKDGDDFSILEWDGEQWNTRVDPKLSDRIQTALDEAKDNAQTLINNNNTSINEMIDQVTKDKIAAALADADFNAQAQAMADKALSDAKANTATVAQDTLNSANANIADAKKSLTDDLNKEVSDRTKAVSDLDTTAQGYADKAKTDAINAATTADGVINKKIDDTASSITTTINQNKTDADGKITTAQSTATQALNQVSTKVSQTDYDKKTGQLQTDLTSTTQTANKATTDIVSIQQKDNTQDARMTQMESDASGVKTTVSNLQTTQGKQSGDISTLQQRADGFDATVTKVNSLSTGDRNYILDTGNPKTQTSDGTDNHDLYNSAIFYSPIKNWGIANGDYIISFDWNLKTALSSDMQASVFFNQSPWDPQNFTVKSGQLKGHVDLKFKLDPRILVASQDITSLTFRIMSQMASGNTITYSNLFMKSGTIITTWTPAPEDLSGATAKAQLTADQATLSINNYKTDADGRISKAQADIVTNANAITQKVSQSDYNAKTGDLTTKVNTAQSTADSATSTIGSYKTSNDARVASAESKITANTNAITQKVSQTDYNQKTGELSGSISTLQQRADGFDATVTKVNNLAVGGRNYVIGTKNALSWVGTGAPNQASTDSNPTSYYTMNRSALGHSVMISYDLTIDSDMPSTASIGLQFYSYPNWDQLVISGAHNSGTYKFSRAYSMPSDTIPTQEVLIRGIANGYSGNISISNVKIEIGNVATDYTPAPEDVDNKISAVSQTVDGISSIVSDPTTGLSKRVQTAEGTLSQVNGTDIPNLQKATYWQPYSSLDFNSYTKQGSFFFNTTSAKTNGPVTGNNSWTYLIVEQGTSDNSRVTQTAWYDSVTSAKVTYKRQYVSGTWSPWYANDNDSVTTISQTNSNVTQEIADRKTGDNNTLQSSKDFTTSSITNYDKGVQSTITQTASGILAQIGNTNLVTNSEFDPDNAGWYNVPAVGATVGSPIKTPISTYFKDVVNNSKGLAFGNGFTTWLTSEPVPITPGTKISMSIFAGRAFSSTTQITMDFRIGRWDANKKFIASSFGPNPINGNTPVPIKTYKVENITVPSDTYYISMVFGHSGSGAGVEDSIYHPMINVGEKSFAYSPTYGTTSSATILSLFKDNWSIGIKDNQSALTSGLFGDINGMTLNGKVVTIDANTTNITGKTWINSAMIANAAIQTVNIADAAITNAKIATLDVAKITGDVSNFIQSNWNGQFGSTTIDSTGMQVVSGKAKTKFGDGSMSIISALGENIGWIGRQVDSTYSNLDFLTIGLNGWQTTAPGDAHYDKNPNNPDDFYGGDGIIFGISTVGGGYLPLLMYNTPLAASYRSGIAGWMFTQPLVGGLDVYGDNMSASNTVAWRFKNIDTRGFTYPFLTSRQADEANVKTGMLLGSGTMYFYGGNNAVFSVKENGFGYYEAKKFGSGGSALYMASDGAFIAHSSATKYKTNIDRNVGKELSEKLLTVDLASWNDKDEDRQLQEYYETGKPTDYAIDMDGAKYYGLIAEDLVKADLEEFVVRNTITGSVESIQYDKIGVAWIPLVRDLRNQVNELKFEIEKIKESMK